MRREPAEPSVLRFSDRAVLLTDASDWTIMTMMTNKVFSVAEAKMRLSELVARAAFGGESFLITRRGRAAAVLRPAREVAAGSDLADLKGWLPEADPLFAGIRESRVLSRRRGPRALR